MKADWEIKKLGEKQMTETKQYFFFDESGDPNILGHHGKNLLKAGIASKTFSVGFVKTKNPKKIAKDLQCLLAELRVDETLKAVPSIKSLENGFHANKDCAEVRREVFRLYEHNERRYFDYMERQNRGNKRIVYGSGKWAKKMRPISG